MDIDNLNSVALESRLRNVEFALYNINLKLNEIDTPKKEELVTVKELCKILDTSYVTLWKRMKNKELPYLRNGRRIYFEMAAVKAAMAKNVNPERGSNYNDSQKNNFFNNKKGNNYE